MQAKTLELNPPGGPTAWSFRDFRVLLPASGVIYFARWMEFTALAYLVLQRTNSPFLVGVVAFFRLSPLALVGPFTGTISDRVDRKKMLMVVQIGQCLVMSLLAAAIVTDVVNLGILIGAALLMGCGYAGDYSSRRALMRDIVGPRSIINATSIDGLVNIGGGKVLGPILAGGLIALFNTGAVFLALASAYALVVVLVSLVREQPRTVSPHRNPLKELVEGFRYAKNSPILIGMMAGTIVGGVTMFPYGSFIPVFARDVLHIGPVLMGVLAAADGVGGGLALLLLSLRRNLRYPGLLYLGGLMVAGLMLLAFAFSHWFGLSLVALLGLGLALGAFTAFQFSVMLLVTPPEMAGRAVGLMLVAMGMQPLGALQMGALTRQLGAPLAVGISGAACALLVAVLMAAIPQMRQREFLPGERTPRAEAKR